MSPILVHRHHSQRYRKQTSSSSVRKTVAFVELQGMDSGKNRWGWLWRLLDRKTGKAAAATDKLRNREAMKRAKDDKEKASQAAADEVANRLGCASDWLPEYLEWLGVDFDVSKEHDMLTLLKTKDIRRAWTDEHDKIIKNCATQLSAYEVKELAEAEENIKVIEHAPEFTATFRSLRHVVSPDPSKTPAAKRQMKKPTKARKAGRFVQVNTSEASRSHTRVPSKNSDDTEFTTSSKDEAYSEEVKAGFLEDITEALGSPFNMEKWKDKRMRLEYLHSDQELKFLITPGNELVTAKDDGGFASKRKGKRYEADEDKSETRQLEISAQIYAELLGQILFGNWTDNPGKITHQEAFSIHVRHSTFYVYYCRFSVAYLQKFVQHGLNVGDHLAKNERMSLLRSKPYNCAVTAERVAFFELMARLLFYVTSGEAEIRCLANNTDNPLLEDKPWGNGIQYDKLHKGKVYLSREQVDEGQD